MGWFLYPLGDLMGQCLLGRFSLERIIVITLLGGIVYRFEIPRWFSAVDSFAIPPESLMAENLNDENPSKTFSSRNNFLRLFKTLVNQKDDGLRKAGRLNWLGRTFGGMIYFNPLWIARHLFFIDLANNHFQVNLMSSAAHCLQVGLESFITNLPVTFVGNYLIQEKLPAHLRFFGSALLSTFMAALYAVEFWFFRHK